MQGLKTFLEWLRPEKPQWVIDSEKCVELYDRYHGILEFATPEEKGLLKKYGFIVEPLLSFPPIKIFHE